MAGYSLGVDLGTTYTAAALWLDGRPETLRFGSRIDMPSELFRAEDDTLVAGVRARLLGRTDPARLARGFKRRFGDSVPIDIDGRDYSVEALTTRLLTEVLDTAEVREAGAPDRVVLTHPAAWGAYRRERMRAVAGAAGLAAEAVDLLAEPVAAATAYASKDRVPTDSLIGIYDLGGGTFDASMVRKTPDSFVLHGEPGGDQRIGGIDFDDALFDHLLDAAGVDRSAIDEDDQQSMVQLETLRQLTVETKEALSQVPSTVVHVHLAGASRQVTVTRADFEAMVRPRLLATVELFGEIVERAGLEVAQLRGVLLVGGSSRIPLVAQLLQSELGATVALDTDHKLPVSFGAAIRSGRNRVSAPPPQQPANDGWVAPPMEAPASAPAAMPDWLTIPAPQTAAPPQPEWLRPAPPPAGSPPDGGTPPLPAATPAAASTAPPVPTASSAFLTSPAGPARPTPPAFLASPASPAPVAATFPVIPELPLPPPVVSGFAASAAPAVESRPNPVGPPDTPGSPGSPGSPGGVAATGQPAWLPTIVAPRTQTPIASPPPPPPPAPTIGDATTTAGATTTPGAGFGAGADTRADPDRAEVDPDRAEVDDGRVAAGVWTPPPMPVPAGAVVTAAPGTPVVVVNTGGGYGPRTVRRVAIAVGVIIVVLAAVVVLAVRGGGAPSTPTGGDRSRVAGEGTAAAGTVLLTGQAVADPAGPDAMRGLAALPSGALVAVGNSVDLHPLAWLRQNDRWQVLALPGDAAMATDVAVAGGRLVAVGQSSAGGARRPAVWLSSDGTSWRQITPVGDLAGATLTELTAVTELPAGGLLAAGIDRGDDRADGDAVVFRSADGQAWQRVTAIGLSGPGPQELRRIVVAGGRLVAVGAGLAGAHRGAAMWTSPDGVRWEPVLNVPADGPALYAAAVQADGSLVVCGSLGSADQPVPTCWVQRAGESWQRYDVRPADGSTTPLHVYALTGTTAVGVGRAPSGTADATQWTVQLQPAG